MASARLKIEATGRNRANKGDKRRGSLDFPANRGDPTTETSIRVNAANGYEEKPLDRENPAVENATPNRDVDSTGETPRLQKGKHGRSRDLLIEGRVARKENNAKRNHCNKMHNPSGGISLVSLSPKRKQVKGNELEKTKNESSLTTIILESS